MQSIRAAVAALALLLTACTGGPATSPSPTGSPTGTPAAASPTAAPTSSPVPTVPATVRPTIVPLPSFAQVVAPSRDVVWVVVGGAVLFRSTDRGVTWEQRPLPTDAIEPEIAFVNDREGWIMSVGSPATQCQAQSVRIWRTTDGGASYRLLAASGLGERQCKSDLTFVDAQRGFVVGSGAQAAPVIYRTTDGGETWVPSEPFPGAATPTTSPRPLRVHVFGKSLLVAVPDPGVAGRSEVYRSADGGAGWVHHATVDAPAFAFVTADRWIDLDAAGESLETTDAGASWHAFTSDYSQAAPIPAVFVFADDEVGYATVRGTIQRTVDGGAHWTSLSTPGT